MHLAQSQPPSTTRHLVHPAFRPDIDGLRAVAVLSVVVFHAFPGLIKGGFIGVDIFFVISGFLISTIVLGSLERRSFGFVDFYARRICRIFPAMVTVLACCLAFGWFGLLADEYAQLGRHVAAGGVFSSNFLLWSESGYFDTDALTKPLLHLWSLGVEWQFYMLWPPALVLARKARIGTGPAIAALATVSFGLNLHYAGTDPVADFYSPQSRFWELLAGALLAHGVRRQWRAPFWLTATLGRARLRPADVLSVAGGALLAGGFAVINQDRGFPGYWVLMPVLGAALIIAAGPQGLLNRTALSARPMTWFGLISFPLYLWHWPLLSFATIIDGQMPSQLVRVAAVVAAIGLAWATWRWVERPLRFGPRPRATTLGLLAAMAAVAAAGFAVHARGGLDGRAAVQGVKDNKDELRHPPSLDDACRAYATDARRNWDYCRFSDVGGRATVAVIGDSHAHAAFAGIAAVLAPAGVNTVLMANSGCPSLAGAEYGATDRDRALCRARIDNILHTVVEKPDITDVIIFSRGPLYLTGKGYGKAERKVNTPPLIPPATFRDALQATVDMLTAAGKRVAYVTENPELGILPGSCVPRPLRPSGKRCALTLETVQQRQAAYLDLVKGVRGAAIIESLPAFCPEGRCKVVSEDGTLYYTDDDHVSASGSLFQARTVLGPVLEDIARRWGR